MCDQVRYGPTFILNSYSKYCGIVRIVTHDPIDSIDAIFLTSLIGALIFSMYLRTENTSLRPWATRDMKAFGLPMLK